MYAKLDDYVFTIESGSSWSLAVGVSPYMGSFVCDKKKALELINKAKVDGSTLTINDGNGTEKKFEKLTILRASPTNNPNEYVLHVVDRRWKWSRQWIKRSYNVRRRTGATKKLATGTINVAEFQPDICYQTWSLNGGKPWTAEEVLKDILKALVGSEGEVDLIGMKDMPVIESLEIDSPGNIALGRIFAVLGNMMSVYIDPSGKAKVFDVFSGKEGELVGVTAQTSTNSKDGSLDLVFGNPTWLVQDRHIERPSKVRVLFTRALEIRFDDKEAAPGTVGSTVAPGVGDRVIADPEIVNVIPVPEDVKYLNNEFPLGSYMPFSTYVAFLAKQATPAGGQLPKISLELINKLWLQGALDAYSALDPSGLWTRRIGAIRSHYRRTYRVARPYSERIRLFSDRRVKLQDAETDGYLAAPAFFDYAVYQSWRGMGLNKAADLKKYGELIKNKFARKDAGNTAKPIVSALLAQLDPAPANIQMIDPVLGIFSINFYQDITARATNYLHSTLTQTPSEDPKASEVWLQDGHLSQSRELSVVLTTFPSAPNDNRQLYAIEIESQVAGNLGQRRYSNQREAIGPVIEVRVMSNVAMARYQWPDDKEKGNKIKQWFAESIDPSDQTANDALEDNAIFGEPINPEELQAVAFTKAREIFAMYTDHIEGGATTNIRPDIEPAGTVKEVVHLASPSGTLTTVTFPPDPPKVDLGQLMPASVRKLVDRGADE